MTTFIHTADWQLGKPFSRVDDPDGQALLRQERLIAIDRIGEAGPAAMLQQRRPDLPAALVELIARMTAR